MGRGLGKLQQAILDHLATEGKPCWSCNIAYTLYHDRDNVHEFGPVPRAFDVSVRRAIRSLEQRGLLRAGIGYDGGLYLDNERPDRLICWLPHQPPPRLAEPYMQADDVDRLVMAALKLAETLTDPYDQRHTFKTFYPPGRPTETCIRYSWVTDQVSKMLGSKWRARVAIHRSVKRLAAQGRIKAYWKSSNGVYGWVRAVDA